MSSTPDRSTAPSPSAPARTSTGRHLQPGDRVEPRELQTLTGTAQLPDPDGVVHLQLRRFAGCPICNLHLRSVVQRREEIAAAGIHELIVFHSSRAELEPYEQDLPLDTVPDPEQRLYRAFGVERSRRALGDLRLWGHLAGIVRQVATDLRHGRPPRLRPTGGVLGLPADVLISAEGRVIAVKYGEHAYDQWTVDELLTLARTRSEAAA